MPKLLKGMVPQLSVILPKQKRELFPKNPKSSSQVLRNFGSDQLYETGTLSVEKGLVITAIQEFLQQLLDVSNWTFCTCLTLWILSEILQNIVVRLHCTLRLPNHQESVAHCSPIGWQTVRCGEAQSTTFARKPLAASRITQSPVEDGSFGAQMLRNSGACDVGANSLLSTSGFEVR